MSEEQTGQDVTDIMTQDAPSARDTLPRYTDARPVLATTHTDDAIQELRRKGAPNPVAAMIASDQNWQRLAVPSDVATRPADTVQ